MHSDNASSEVLTGAPGSTTCSLDVHGLRVLLQGEWPEVVEALRLDFAWFEVPHDAVSTDVQVTILRRPPDFGAFGGLVASFITPRNVVYQDGGRTIIDYFGRALSVFERETGRLVIEGTDSGIVHEAAYQFLLSHLGEYFDSRKTPRMHGLGLLGDDGAVILMLPSGGGKTTMALRALQDEHVKLLSEDSPLLDTRGRLTGFPLRIGVNVTDAQRLPPGHVRTIERMEFHPKYALELGTFADRIDATPQPLRHLVIGRRSLGSEAQLEALPRRAAISPLFREVVVGVGLYQGLEFVLQRGLRDVFGKSGVALMRMRCCAGALRRATVWRLTLGRDPDANWAALEPLLRPRR